LTFLKNNAKTPADSQSCLSILLLLRVCKWYPVYRTLIMPCLLREFLKVLLVLERHGNCMKINIEFHFILILPTLMHMYVESNPGPVQSLSSISLFHWNARSVRHNIVWLIHSLTTCCMRYRELFRL